MRDEVFEQELKQILKNAGLLNEAEARALEEGKKPGPFIKAFLGAAAALGLYSVATDALRDAGYGEEWPRDYQSSNPYPTNDFGGPYPEDYQYTNPYPYNDFQGTER